jgi:hypothetical protein
MISIKELLIKLEKIKDLDKMNEIANKYGYWIGKDKSDNFIVRIIKNE